VKNRNARNAFKTNERVPLAFTTCECDTASECYYLFKKRV
jgi:hypothetical protein